MCVPKVPHFGISNFPMHAHCIVRLKLCIVGLPCLTTLSGESFGSPNCGVISCAANSQSVFGNSWTPTPACKCHLYMNTGTPQMGGLNCCKKCVQRTQSACTSVDGWEAPANALGFRGTWGIRYTYLAALWLRWQLCKADMLRSRLHLGWPFFARLQAWCEGRYLPRHESLAMSYWHQKLHPSEGSQMHLRAAWCLQ